MGVRLAGRRAMSAQQDTVVRFRIDRELKEHAQAYCAQQGIPLSRWLRKLVSAELNRHSSLVRLSDGTRLSQ